MAHFAKYRITSPEEINRLRKMFGNDEMDLVNMHLSRREEERFGLVAEKVYEYCKKKNKGDRIRHLVRLVANAYKNKPRDLLYYLTDRDEDCQNYHYNRTLVAGVASSAYYLLTGDLEPIFDVSLGGIGVIFKDPVDAELLKRKNIEFSRIATPEECDPQKKLLGNTPENDPDSLEKRKRFESIVQQAYDHSLNRRKGNRIRNIVRIVAKAYQENPDALKDYFNDSLVGGIATSAYHRLSKNSLESFVRQTLFQNYEFGGLGAVLNLKHSHTTRYFDDQGLKNLCFSRNQLKFAKISGNELTDSINSQDALQYTENSEEALFNSTNKDNALVYSCNRDIALTKSRNSGNALQYSDNRDDTLSHSQNSDNALQHSNNHHFVLSISDNQGRSLQYSHNEALVLIGAEFADESLKFSQTEDRVRPSMFARIKGANNSCKDIPYHTQKRLDQFDIIELAQWRLEELLAEERKGIYRGVEAYKEQGFTRDVFLARRGLEGDIPVIIKSDKKSPKSQRIKDTIVRGRNTRNDISLSMSLANGLHVTRAVDYIPPDVARPYGIEGAVVIEEYFEDSRTFDDYVREHTLSPMEVITIFDDILGTIGRINSGDAVRNRVHVFHRDIKPSNILIRDYRDRKTSNEDIDSGSLITPYDFVIYPQPRRILIKPNIQVCITDFAFGARESELQERHTPTKGGLLTADPLIITNRKTRFDRSSELYSVFACMYYGVTGRHLFDFDQVTRVAKASDGRIVYEQDGDFDQGLYEEELKKSLDGLPKEHECLRGTLERYLTCREGTRDDDTALGGYLSLDHLYYPEKAKGDLRIIKPIQ